MKKRDRFRSKANDIKGMMGGFIGKVDNALKLGAFKSTKLDSLLQHTLSRLAILKNQRRLRCAHGRSDIAELLQNGHHDLALLRAEYVLNEQKMLEVFDMVQSYCSQLIEKYALLKHQKKCPDELKETIASLIFASSECDELPELDDIRSLFLEKFGKDFVASCTELHDFNGVSSNLIEKLSKREQSSESKTMLLKEIASEKDIKVDLDASTSEKLSEIVKEAKKFINNLNLNQPTPPNSGVNSGIASGCSSEDDLPQSTTMMQRYQNARNKVNPDHESDTSTSAMKHFWSGSNEKNSDDQNPSPSGKTTPNSIFKMMDGSGFESRAQSDNSKLEIEIDVLKQRNAANNSLELGNMKSSKGNGFGKLVSSTYDADAEEEWHHKSRVKLETRRTKWKGLAFHMKRHTKLASEEDATSNGHGFHM